jgi:uncharacterized protein YaiE (UPF0345 family)
MLKVNEYFDGKVKSIGFQTGILDVQLPGTSGFKRFEAGSSFIVAANQKFQLKVPVDTAYLCTYE